MTEELLAQGWAREVSLCGGCVAAVKGTEIHVEFTRKGVIGRRAVREFLGPLLAREGLLTTRTFLDDQVNDRFVRRIGFKPTWSDSYFRYYAMTALPFGKEH